MDPELCDRTYYVFEKLGQTDAVDISKEQMIRTVESDEDRTGGSERMPGFWRRQFRGDATPGQKKFDWTFGVILPMICIYLDPIVFQNKIDTRAYMADIATFSYVLSYAAIIATMAWLLWGNKLQWLNAPLSGLFAVSSVAAASIGVVLIPFSVFGLAFMLIGALGFTPLFCSFVLFRNSIRAYRAASSSLESDLLQSSFALSAVTSAVIPYLLNLWSS
jgi:hypothetical protein